jgi:hypothetical protein
LEKLDKIALRIILAMTLAKSQRRFDNLRKCVHWGAILNYSFANADLLEVETLLRAGLVLLASFICL